MKTTLFKLIDAADVVELCGYEAIEVQYGEFFGTEGATLVRLEDSDDATTYFADQPVVFENGQCSAIEAREDGGEPTTYRLSFKAVRPLRPDDMPPTEAMTQHIGELIAELRRTIDEPTTFTFGPDLFIEVRPADDDLRVSVIRKGWGFTTVHYTYEGLIVDVIDENADVLGTACYDSADLEAGNQP